MQAMISWLTRDRVGQRWRSRRSRRILQ